MDERKVVGFLSGLAEDRSRAAAFRADPRGVLEQSALSAADVELLAAGDARAIAERFDDTIFTAGQSMVMVGPDDGHGSLWHPPWHDERPWRLTIAGTGYRLLGQLTPEARRAIEVADRVFTVVDAITRKAIEALRGDAHAEGLEDLYEAGKPRGKTYAEMVERILGPARDGLTVCAAFYGHPGMYAAPGHMAIRRAQAEGIAAGMLPGIDAFAMMVADLGFDPAVAGVQEYEATDFLLRKRVIDPHAALVLWQAGGIGISTFEAGTTWNRRGVEILAAVLGELYGEKHEVVLYSAAVLPIHAPRIEPLAIAELGAAEVTLATTILVPPIGPPPVDRVMAAALGVPLAGG